MLRQAASRSSPPQPGDVIDANRTRVQFDGLAREWRQRAATRAGDDVIANVLLIMGASKGDAVSQAAARRWADAQPDNSAPLLLSTDLPVDGMLQAAAARHYDSAYLPTLRWIRDALSAYPAEAQIRPSAGDAEPMTEHVHATMLALELSTGNAISAYSRIVGSCRADAPEVQTACRSVATQLLDADTVLARDWGRALMTQLVGPDGEAARKSAWTILVMQRATAEHEELQYTRLLDDASIRTEIDLQARILSDAGLASAPPSDWMPATP
ncbi:hypothetical protein [Luteimonas deserti]|uniref:Uncharacterized protein n=1 Tax=Luteimonas deserti TaxID=2752306 RepID=A0A7Z0TYQ8_9GAMM|nr:hypothetical protein [Luteimonas deserti]NYZ61403.1 hypothetical protein [Luteimonas deserti]